MASRLVRSNAVTVDAADAQGRRQGRSQVVAIGVTQEYQRVFTGTKDQTPAGVRHEAPCDRVEVKDLHRHVVVAT